MNQTTFLCLTLLTFNTIASDAFQVMSDSGEGYAKVTPKKEISFPADHLAHSDYRLEWWYLTANLVDQQGRDWGLQWTLFRQALSAQTTKSAWSSNQLWMAHAAVSSPAGHQFEQRFARGGIGQAGVDNKPRFEAWIDDWQWLAQASSPFPAMLKFNVGDMSVEMHLSSANKWVLHGDRGYSQKSAQGQASYYYSQPQIEITGQIGKHSLAGSAWLDREWSSQPLADNQSGWDWFSLHLHDGKKLMLYRLRHTSGEHWLSGSWIGSDGTLQHLSADTLELAEMDFRVVKTSKKSKLKLPLDWRISLPGLTRQLHVTPLYDQQWMGARFPYWEGVVVVEDNDGNRVGEGYMELTGYR
ncbi:MAG: carotenoid 1,2-hydratase [Gammaproteobacteria bacterium]|nr:carotenoid 1,2-hydratase [Gammaproteobacteria bacterium]